MLTASALAALSGYRRHPPAIVQREKPYDTLLIGGSIAALALAALALSLEKRTP